MVDIAESDISFNVDEESDYDEDMTYGEENVAPPKTKASKPASKNSVKGSVLSPNRPNVVSTAAKGGKKEKTIEERYQKKTQLEHILLRPDTYIGAVEKDQKTMFVVDPETKRLVKREITYTPGLYKIFDEIVVNASDNKQRDPNMDKLDITIDAELNVISVKNNGKGIPIEMHKEHKCYVPTMIFGHLLTGSNFDDDEKKTTGGRNGYGAKLANIFSTEFTVECLDTNLGLKFKQTWRNNMSIAEEPIVKKCTAAEKKAGDFVRITFSPDLKRFKMDNLDDDTVALLSKRAYDIAGVMGMSTQKGNKKLAVSLNGEKLPIKSFQDYVKLIDGVNSPVAYEKVSDHWEIGVAASDGSPQQISFVNSICTSKGGTHVSYIADQIGSHLIKTVKKKNKGGSDVKPALIKQQLCVFVNCLVVNPTFDSQTKDFLTSRPKNFGSSCKIAEAFLKKVDKSEIVDQVLSFAKFKENQQLKKKGGTKKSKLTGIPKLEDANNAGTAKSKDCTLIITEGDSAKSLAMSGISVVGRDYYGVFPLKGKPLNVRDATHTQVMKNAEIENIFKIMGFNMNEKYDEDNIKKLRYGHLVIMADQDHDGSHIKGLVINMIHKYWPSLLDVPGFLQQFITPIVKASKAKKTKTFFTLPEYLSWKESTGNDAKGWTIKYYKGLGTSTSAEAKEYFSNLDRHLLNFCKLSMDFGTPKALPAPDADDSLDFDDSVQEVVPSGNDLIDMAFAKSRVKDRKEWLNGFEKDTFMDYSKYQESGVTYSDFINKEFILFSISDCARSIPHVMDGFKPSQRKVLFACFKKNLTKENKVAQLAGYIGEHSAYHHGEASLHSTIINLAQQYVGSNNINLLTPAGQFGTRRMGGKDHASPRYIFTKLESITRAIFHPADDEVLTYLNDDGMSVEPEYYMPVIPMVLINGVDGIGTGWSSKVPNYNPRDIISNLRNKIQGEDLVPMKPYYAGFTGEIVEEVPSKFVTKGKIERINNTTLHISELAINHWTQNYKEFLEGLVTGDTKKNEAPLIKDFKENHTDTTVSFTITAEPAKIDGWEAKGELEKVFKLTSSISTGNMHLFNKEHRIVNYATPEKVLDEFYDLRLEFYAKRKACLVDKLQKEQKMLSNKARFVEEVCAGSLVVSNRKRADILGDLQERGYDLFNKTEKTPEDADEEEEEEEDLSDAELAKGYEYLLGMKIWSLTYEKAAALRAQLAERTKELEELEATTPSQIWLNDLDAIESLLDGRDIEIEEALNDDKKAQRKGQARQKATQKKAAATKKKGKKKKADEWDSDMEDEDEIIDIDSDSDIEIVPKKTAGRARKQPTKPATKKLAAPPAAKKAPAKKAQENVDEMQVDDIELSLADRMKKRMVISPPGKQKKPSTLVTASAPKAKMAISIDLSAEDDSKHSRGKKRPSPKASDEDDEDVADLSSKAKRPPAKKAKKPAPKKATTGRGKAKKMDLDDSDDEFGFDSDVEEIPAPRAAAAASGRPARARAQTKKATYVYSDDDFDSDDSEF